MCMKEYLQCGYEVCTVPRRQATLSLIGSSENKALQYRDNKIRKLKRL